MDDELTRAQLDFLDARICELTTEMQRAEMFLGLPITATHVQEMAAAVVARLGASGNAALAERYREKWEAYRGAVQDFAEAYVTADEPSIRLAQEAAEDAEEDFERVVAQVTVWFCAES